VLALTPVLMAIRPRQRAFFVDVVVVDSSP
jgi:hypothetical protein